MYISIDMGGTYTRVASSKDLKSINKSVKFDTQKDLLNQQNLISYNIKIVSDNDTVSNICMGVPGTLDIKNKKYLKFANYKVLEGKNFDELLSQEYKNVHLIVVNDAHMAGYSEAVRGSGKDFKNVLYISIGTGIGGIWIRDKKMDDIFENFEPGHEVIFSDGLDFESHCAGKSFTKNYGYQTNKDTPVEVWKEYSKQLCKGLSFLKTKYPSDVIVLGGGFTVNNFDYFKEYLLPELNIKKCEFGDDTGLVGGIQILSDILNTF